MELYTYVAGPYVWPRFTYTEAFCGGGAMEYNMLVMAEPDFKTTLFRWMENTVAHELAHNWFYGMIGSDERAFPWLDEGFAQYSDHRYTDETFPKGMFVYQDRMPWLSGYTMRSRNERDYLDRAWARDERPLSTPANGHTGYATYGTSAYSKPASMLHTLRGVLGDSVFTEFLREYYRRGVLRHPMPEDVRGAAEAASGQDLSGFFHSWVETLDRPSFSLSRKGSKRSSDGYTTQLVVNRKGEMVFPVTVQARFRDGSVEEQRVVPEARSTTVDFPSRSPLSRATLDPRHEVIEMDRLDNQVGGFWPAPMRVRPFFGFPSPDYVGIDAGPTFWYGTAEGVRLGAWLDGRYLPSQDFPYGLVGFEAGLSAGTKDGSIAYRAGSWTRWGAIGARSRLRWLVADDEGLFRSLVSAENLITGSGRRYPHRSWRVSVEYRNRDDREAVDPRYWSEGKTLEPRLEVGLDTRGPRRTERYHLGYGHGFRPDLDWSDGFDRLEASVRQDLDLLPAGNLHVGWRAVASGADGQLPQETLGDVAEASRLEALRYFYANDLGPIRNTDHYFLSGGGGLRGYADRAILGDRVLAFNLEAQHDSYPVRAFGGVARVRNYVAESFLDFEPRQTRTYSEAGLGFTYGPVQLDFPFWLGTPDPGESPWKVRWLFTFLPLKLPRL
jgi:peptidase M1-like protein